MIDYLPALVAAVTDAGVTLPPIAPNIASSSGPILAWASDVGLRELFKRRAETGRSILLAEMRGGHLPTNYVAPGDELIAILHRYQRAAFEGTARLNLRLMAQVIRGQISATNLNANDFLYYADILASLRRPEIVVLGTVVVLDREIPAGNNRIGELGSRLKAKLIGHPMFPDEGALLAYCNSVVRFGLLLEGISGERSFWAPFPVLPSLILNELAAFVDIEDALKSESEASKSEDNQTSVT